MCGIIAYVGDNSLKDILISSLERLEYRGYDSSGIGIIEENQIKLFKEVGKVQVLKDSLNNTSFSSNIGIGHTRWATHGEVNKENAHPHISLNSRIALVHNGIIENYLELKEELVKHNVSFYGKTDTEVIVKYLEYIYDGNPLNSIERLKNKLKGSYALIIIFLDFSNHIYFIKKDSPLLIGLTSNGILLSSDVFSIDCYTNKIIYINDDEYGYISKSNYFIFHNKKKIIPIIKELNITNKFKENTYSSYLEKEIYEGRDVVDNLLNKYIVNNQISFSNNELEQTLSKISHINIFGCGSSYNVGLIGKYLFEEYCKIPTSTYLASEYPNARSIYYPSSLNIFISQSGETRDLLSIVNLIKENKLGIINVEHSSLANKMDFNLFLEAGKENSVATTKAYLGQLTFLTLLTLFFLKIKGEETISLIKELKLIPSKINQILTSNLEIKNFASTLKSYEHVFFIGRGLDYLTCIEGSLKLKEVTYIHSESIPSGELKHGTISLIDDKVYVISLLSSETKEKTKANIEEIKARKGKVFTVSTSNSDYIIPSTNNMYYPFLEIVPLQLLSLYVGQEKNLDIDKPRNLAKSVTVE